MRILHITEAAVGGVATYLDELLLPQLVRYRPDGDVGLLIPNSEVSNLSSKLADQACLFTYRRNSRDPISLVNLAIMTWRTIRIFRPDVVHAHSSFAGFIVRCLPIRPPIVYSPHGWAFDIEGLGKPRRIAYLLIERWLARRSHAIINVSISERSSGLEAGLPDRLLKVVRTGISIKRSRTRQYQQKNGPLKLLFVGRFDHEKGLPWFLNVFTKLPKDRFSLLAIGGFVREKEHSPISNENFKVLDWMPSELLDQYYDDADLVVIPSRWEAFGLVAVEAMRRGCPVIASDRGALPELMENGNCGANLPLEKPEEWEKLLLTLNHEQLATWGHNAQQHFIKNFTSAKMLDATHRIYQEVSDG